MPVFPPVASTIVMPGFNTPRNSASSMRATATRSFTFPQGFRISNFASTRPGKPLARRPSSTSGVCPTVAMRSGWVKRSSFLIGLTLARDVLTMVQCHHGLYNRCDLTANVDAVHAIFALDIYVQQTASPHPRSLFAHKPCAGSI